MGLSKKLDISGVLATGRPLDVDAKVDVPAFESWVFDGPAHVVLEVERVDRGIGISGSIDAPVAGSCDRCLAEVRRSFHVDVDECVNATAGAEGAFADNNVLAGGLLDVADLTRQLVDSALPMVLLCTDDCPGLCPSCGLSRREGACACPVSATR